MTPDLEIEIDVRLFEVWLAAWGFREWNDAFAPLMRMAYGAGYYDALRDIPRGKLCIDHGLIIPENSSG